jgi:hypothetical protein
MIACTTAVLIMWACATMPMVAAIRYRGQSAMTPPVSEFSTLQLVQGETVLGTLTYNDVDFPWVNCTFVATPAFISVKPLFDAELHAAEDDWEQIYTQILSLGLQLVNQERNQCIDTFLLHIEDTWASFRY